MNPNLLFDFSVDKEKKTITVKREFAAGRALVWDAYTKAELLDQWWAPRPWKAKTKTMDFREGGQWLYAMMGPAGEIHWALASYKTIQPQRKFIGVDSFTDADGNITPGMPQQTWEATFTDKGSGTLVELRISLPDLAQLEAIISMGFKEGLTMAMEGLDELLPSLKK
jgi:uncharacterized protein YndB with AHSA1/START domain